MFDSVDRLLLGLVTGIAFGFLLQKGRVAKFEVIVGQLLLRDWTVAKIMLTAIVVGAIGVYAMVGVGWVGLHIKPAVLGGILAGGAIFGVGMALMGYCPGTCVAAAGEGRRDAIVGIAGLLFGSTLYVVFYPAWQTVRNALGDWGKLTLPEWTGVSAWVWIAALVIGAAAAFVALERYEAKRRQTV